MLLQNAGIVTSTPARVPVAVDDLFSLEIGRTGSLWVKNKILWLLINRICETLQ